MGIAQQGRAAMQGSKGGHLDKQQVRAAMQGSKMGRNAGQQGRVARRDSNAGHWDRASGQGSENHRPDFIQCYFHKMIYKIIITDITDFIFNLAQFF